MPNEYAAFISYSHRYAPWVRTLQKNLERCLAAAGRPGKVFLDQADIRSGHSWVAELEKGLATSEHFVLVATPEAVASSRVTDECHAFMAGNPNWKEGQFHVALLVDAPMPPFLEPIQRVDFRKNRAEPYRQALRELVSGLLGCAPRELPELPADIEFQPLAAPILEPSFQRLTPEDWRQQQNRFLREALRSLPLSRAAFGQPLHVAASEANLVVRPRAMEELDSWWHSWTEGHRRFVLLGEEGDGKSWAVAAWLNRLLENSNAPPIVFVPSTGASNPAPLELIGDVVQRQIRSHESPPSEREIRQWLESPPHERPTLLLVLDGINERNAPEYWRGLLEQIAGEQIWAEGIAVIVTCRTGYWRRHLGRVTHIADLSHSWELPPYDDVEVEAALARMGRDRGSFVPSVLELIRKPRYLVLATKHCQRLLDSGEVTKERLIYEDWRSRTELKRHQLLSDLEFQGLLKNLADRYRSGQDGFSEREVATELPVRVDASQALDELRTGGIFDEVDGRLRLDSDRLTLGLGLLLVSSLEDTARSGESDLDEEAARWLEPYAGADIKSGICHQAVLHALSLGPEVPKSVKVSLLRAWAANQNPGPDFGEAFCAYLPLSSDAYSAFAEKFWSEQEENPWLEKQLVRSWVINSSNPKVTGELRRALERWLGFVHPASFPIRRSSEDQEEVLRQELRDRLGAPLGPEDLVVAGYRLDVIEEDGLLGLGYVALAVISHLPSADWVPLLARGVLAEAVMDFPEKYDLFSWVLRSAREDLWPAVEHEAFRLINAGGTVAIQAAYRLLECYGSDAARKLAKTLPNDLFPENSWIEEYRRDPCLFVWEEREVCETCLKREDFNPIVRMRMLKPWIADPTLVLPESFLARVRTLAEELPAEKRWRKLHHDSDADQLIDTLSVADPAAIPEICNRWIQAASIRHGVDLWHLALEVTRLQIFLTDDSLSTLRSCWQQLSSSNSAEEYEDVAEAFLFAILLTEMEAEEQLEQLCGRRSEARDLSRFEPAFKTRVGKAECLVALDSAQDGGKTARILWFLSRHANLLPRDFVARVAGWAQDGDNLIRLCALRILAFSQWPDAGSWLSGSGWQARRGEDFGLENEYGSWTLAKYSHHLTWPQLVQRIDPAFLGFAVRQRGYRPEEVAAYAERLDQAWMQLGSVKSEPAPEVPSIEIEVPEVSDHIPLFSRLRAVSDAADEIVLFGRKTGGSQPTEEELRRFFQGPSEEQNRLQSEAVQAEVSRQRELGNFWFGRDFRTDCLDRVLAARPDLIDKWVTKESVKAWWGASFFLGLCQVLLKSHPEQGLALYRRLKRNRGRNRIVWKEIDVLDLYLFEAPRSQEIEAAWKERLDDCTCDQELLGLVIAAEKGDGSGWLWDICQSELESRSPFLQARALMILGFSDLPGAQEILLARAAIGDPEGWLQSTAKRAYRVWRKNAWARDWYRVFLSAEDDSRAGAAFRRFLHCVDRRFWVWEPASDQQLLTHLSSGRRRFFRLNNQDTIKNRINDNERDLEKQFSGCKVLKQQVAPWYF